MSSVLSDHIRSLVQRAPGGWLLEVCDAMRSMPSTASAEFLKTRLPATSNANLTYLLFEVLDSAAGQVSWDALGYGVKLAFETYFNEQNARQIEMLWSGPQPPGHLAARRIDQALYDLIAEAEMEILLVTFAAAKVERLGDALLNAAARGVKIKLILEFTEASEGQLSFDALKAFPAGLAGLADVFYWPVDRRERNQAGRPGKLHAKIAVIDRTLVLSSANMTDDAFVRNLEIGIRITDSKVCEWVREHFYFLVKTNVLKKIPSP